MLHVPRVGLQWWSYLLLLHLGSSQPEFPPGLDDIMSGMRNDTEAINTKNVDEETVLGKLKKRASETLQSSLVGAEEEFGLSQAAYVAARIRLLKLLYFGGCPRDMSKTCPEGWAEDQGRKTCKPIGQDYKGRCGETPMKDIRGSHQKEAFAWKCQASWPCVAHCKKDFSGCPMSWESVGKLCLAPGVYGGMCSPAMDFESFSKDDKLQWSMLCKSDWPCADHKEQQFGDADAMNGPIDLASVS